jgi:hypothetical protein
MRGLNAPMRFSLRTLLIISAVGAPVTAGLYLSAAFALVVAAFCFVALVVVSLAEP